MKKLVLVFAVAFSASLYSCGNAEKAADNAADVVEDAVEEAVVEVPDTLWLNDTTAVVGTDTIYVNAAAEVVE